MRFPGAHMLYRLDVVILALYLLPHVCALLKYMYKHSWFQDIQILYSVLNPFNYYFVFNSLEILLCFQSTENVNQFSIYWKCYSVFNILKMLLSFQYIENVTPFLIHSKSYSVFNLLVMLLHSKYVEFYLVFTPFKY